MKTRWKVLLILVAVGCFAVALSYPINTRRERAENEANMEMLAAIREAGRLAGEAAETTSAPDPAQPTAAEATSASEATLAPEVASATVAASASEATLAPEATLTPEATLAPEAALAPEGESVQESPTPAATEAVGEGEATITASAAPRPSQPPEDGGSAVTSAPQTPEPTPAPTPTPTATPDRRARTGALAYPDKEKVVFNEEDILPEFRELYEMNHDLVGWLTIPGTKINYPVVQCDDSEYYLSHDFFGKENKNGQIILDTKCDPYTPSYNLVISGHNMFNEAMFGPLLEFVSPNHWKRHKLLEFDVLTEKRQYVIFAAFASADYDVDEEGFRYNADIQYRVDAERWLEQVRENQMYDTEIDAAFGDEFLTLTTCNRRFRERGRMVVVCRRIREGEEF